jgi:excisionase family DNA binding protein
VTSNDLDPPTETTLILRLAALTEAVERLTAAPTAAELELKCFTPEEAAPLLGKTANWIREACRDGRIPHTNVGKSPRLTADHIRQIRANGERLPHKYAKPARVPAAA